MLTGREAERVRRRREAQQDTDREREAERGRMRREEQQEADRERETERGRRRREAQQEADRKREAERGRRRREEQQEADRESKAERGRRRREEQQEADREREAERGRRRREEQQDSDQRRTSARVRQQQRRAITPAVTGSGRVYLGPTTTVCQHWKHHHRSAVGGALSWDHCRWRAVATVWRVLASSYNYMRMALHQTASFLNKCKNVNVASALASLLMHLWQKVHLSYALYSRETCKNVDLPMSLFMQHE